MKNEEGKIKATEQEKLKELAWSRADESARAVCLNGLWEVRTLYGRTTNTVEDIQIANAAYNGQMERYQSVEVEG